MKKVAINGFGRIGRTVFRAWLDYVRQCKVMRVEPKIMIVAVNNPLKKGQKVSDFLHLLEYDSVHGRLRYELEETAGGFKAAHMEVKFYQEMDPTNIPWQNEQVDVVIDSTGIFKDKAGLSKHLHDTVKKVVMCAPGDGLDGTFVMGVNDDKYDPNTHHVISNASCTTNCLAPVVKALDDALGIESGLISTCHSYTADQKLVDGEHEDLRRARAANLSIIPTKTGAAKAIGEIIPHLKGKLDGFALRVPTPNVSVVDATFVVKKGTTKEEVNQILKDASKKMLGILAVSEKELVSVDYNGDTYSSTVDAKYTQVMNGTLVKVLSWYDNETGYSNRVLDLVKKL